MNERVVEILIYIMSEIRRNHSVSQKLDILSKNLIKQGYTESEISSALTWILDRIDDENGGTLQRIAAPSKHSFRHLHEIERTVVTVEAYGYLIQLKELAIIDDLEFEQILERALMLGSSQISIDDVKAIVVSVLFNPENFLEGKYFILENSSTIH